MSGNPGHQINQSLYEWCVRGFSLLRRRVGLNMTAHAADGLIEAGQIFQFNHFARFETIVPQYFIHQATGAFCRCVAHHSLFSGNERLAKLLWSVGAVPSNHPGLLAFLAAEILRGRKVIIFPEGSMIKDRRIAAAPQSALLPSLGPSSAHRQGAAALAIILEIFKKRILSVHEAGDLPRLDRWVAALGLGGRDALIAAARKPTLIVPSNITFHPIHTGDNILRKAAEFLHLDLGQRAEEELLVEGNLVLRNTDMDIRFGQPFHPDVAWNLAERVMLARIFEQIDSLDELFGLNDTASRWVERMAALTMRRATRRLRDLCMGEMYARVTVNLSHLAARLVLRLLEAGETEIEKSRFHGLLYRIVKDVQLEPGLHLHRTLADPEAYDGLHAGAVPALTQFFAAAEAANLIAVTPSHYRLLPAIQGGGGQRDPRLENVIGVYANEIALLTNVIKIVERAVAASGETAAKLLFDDELRSRAHSRQKYAEARHATVNKLETAGDHGEPFLLMPEAPSKSGVVLAHGFLANPASLRQLAQRLVDAGHPVLGVRLKGHGTSPWDLRERNWRDWLASVRRGYEIMSHLSETVLLAGFGTGASLALQVAASRPPGLRGVVAVSAPLKFRDQNVKYAPLYHGINRLAEWVYAQDGVKPFHVTEPDHPHFEYRHMPVRALVELRKVIDALDASLPEIKCPVAIIQATDDPAVDPASARLIHSRIGSLEKSLHMIPSKRHAILHENIGDTEELVVSLLGTMAASVSLPAPQPVALVPRMAASISGLFRQPRSQTE